ncbi:hypothetical protein BDA96_03G291700 [Sorghum bicolor]|uniref:Uncharacterized protein n=2 Tax=Sorghum bicolor TaxID=4558 RepID=A0A1B6Q5L5_SORBI|nr:hypothetical protein BDA96_03G291700 [Sorghum bicolor]KXG33201.1 hypothetical protein SORBI_3003G270000 [Sorghum bicolor]
MLYRRCVSAAVVLWRGRCAGGGIPLSERLCCCLLRRGTRGRRACLCRGVSVWEAALPWLVAGAVVQQRGGSRTARHEGDATISCVSLLSCFKIDNAFDFFH